MIVPRGRFGKVPMPPWEDRPLMEGRMRASLISILTIGAAALLAATGLAAPGLAPPSADNSATAVPVDVELVLAVDVSYSMDPDEQALQREGYIAGITSREFMQALRSGQHGKVAVTYFEWAGPYDQKIVVPWRLIVVPRAPRFRARLILPNPCSMAAVIAAFGAWSTSPATEPTTAARSSPSRATTCLPPASPSTACRSC